MKISESKLRKSIRRMLFETTYNLYTTADKSAGKFAVDSDEEPPEDGSYDAANPSMVMATQLTQEMPPIDDDDYQPNNSSELANAAQAMMSVVADDQVAFIYKNLQRLVVAADDRAAEVRLIDPAIDDLEELETPVNKKGKTDEVE
jgi:hypothetical protein